MKASAQALMFLVLSLCLGGADAFGLAAPNGAIRQAHATALSMMESSEMPLSSRRSWLTGAGLATSALLTQVAFPEIASAADKLETYEDINLNFQIKVPSNWEKQVQTLPDRRKILLFIDPTSDKDKSLLFFAFTPVRDDFTSLSSFGSVDQVAQMTILPKGELAGQENASKMIKAESKKNSYFFDYEAKATGQPLVRQTLFASAQLPSKSYS